MIPTRITIQLDYPTRQTALVFHVAEADDNGRLIGKGTRSLVIPAGAVIQGKNPKTFENDSNTWTESDLKSMLYGLFAYAESIKK